VAVDRRDLDARPERGLREPDPSLVDQLGALAPEARVGGDVDGDIQASGRPAPRPGLALVGQPDLMALVDARRDRDPEGPAALGPAVAAAGRAGRLDDPALAAAAGAGRDVDHLAEHRLADHPDLAAALALGARRRVRSGLGAAAAARLAPPEDRELDLLLRAQDRLLERDPEVVPEIRAGRRAAAPRGAGRAAEERVEDVREAAHPTEAGGDVRLHSGGAEHVVALPALRVRQDLVRLVELLEPLRRRRVGADVRVPLLGQAPERLLDLRVGRRPLHSERGVVVRACHQRARIRVGAPSAVRSTMPAWSVACARRRA
jgi:hypothetical protein